MFRDMKQLFIRNSVILILAAAFIAAAGSFAFSETSFTGAGTGSKDDPYIISSVSELEEIRQMVSEGHSFEGEYLKLSADIDLPEGWEPIGTLAEGASDAGNGKNILPFSGDLNGNGYTVTSSENGYPLLGYVRGAEIRNLKISGSRINGNGLIRNYVVDYGPNGGSNGVPTAVIKNVTIKAGTNITGSGFVGGYASGGNTVDITDCVAEEGVVVGCDKDRDRIGSFGGEFNGTVKGCESAATVYGKSFVGGIIGCKGGSMGSTSVTGCTFTGKVEASGQYAGGISGAGYGGTRWGFQSAPNAPMMTITSCLVTGSVTAGDIAGGIIGFEPTVQPWNPGYFRSNLFAGSVSVTSEEGTCGAIVGAFRGLSRLSTVEDNYYSGSCGADRGIGKVTYVDTSCATHETAYGENYFDSGSGEIPVYEGLNDVYPENLKAGYNRTDDPLGADAEKLAKMVTEEELADGTVTLFLNNAAGSQKNWTQGEKTPVISREVVIVGFDIEDGYQKDYYVGQELDKGKLNFRVLWSDGKEETITGDDEEIQITGFRSSERAYLTLTAVYRGLSVRFPVRVIIRSDISIVVSFTLLGDRAHGPRDEGVVHFRAGDNLERWIDSVEYEIDYNSTARDLIVKVLDEKGLGIKGTDDARYGSYYISGVQIPGTDEYLMEKYNGANSGWMYSVNDVEPGIGINQYFLEEGDEVVLFYTDDFTLEKSSYGGQEIADRVAAQIVMNHIIELPYAADARYEDIDSILSAGEEYDRLTDDQKAYVSENIRKKLEDLLDIVDTLKPDEEPKVVKGGSYTVSGSVYTVTKVAGTSQGTVTLTKSKNAKKVTVPASVKLADGKIYKVTVINGRSFKGSRIRAVVIGKNVKQLKRYAFTGSKASKIYLKTKLLKKVNVKYSLKKSKVTAVRVSVGTKKANRTYVRRYRKIFTKKNAGKKVRLS